MKSTQGRRCYANPGLSDLNPVGVAEEPIFILHGVPPPRGMKSTFDHSSGTIPRRWPSRLELGGSRCAVRISTHSNLMIKFVLLLSLLSLSGTDKDDSIPATEFVAPQAIQDSRTKVIYYLESDHRHVVAIDPEGKILWCCEVVSEKERFYRKNSGIGEKKVVKEKDGNREDRSRDAAVGRTMGSGQLRV